MNASGLWTINLPAAEAAALVTLLAFPELEVGEDKQRDLLWVRGGAASPEIERALRSLPACASFHISADGKLTPPGCRLASGRLPDLAWRPIAEVFEVHLPAPALPGAPARKASLRLERGGAPREPDGLMTPWDAWARWALSAPDARLEKLRFAVFHQRQALILGLPLPPLPGSLFNFSDGIAAPAGFTWLPAVSRGVLRRLFNLEEDEILVWLESNAIIKLPAGCLVSARRSAIRLTAEALADA